MQCPMERRTGPGPNGGSCHEFWADEVSVRDLRSAKGHTLANRQQTDLYLLALAHHRNGRLTTFDRSIPLDAVGGGTSRHLEIIPA